MMRVLKIIFIIIIIKIARQLIVIRKIKLHKGKHSNYTECWQQFLACRTRVLMQP